MTPGRSWVILSVSNAKKRRAGALRFLNLSTTLLQWSCGKDADAFRANRVQGRGIDRQGAQNGRCDLCRAHGSVHRPRLEAWVREQQNDVGVVMREPAVLFLLL